MDRTCFLSRLFFLIVSSIYALPDLHFFFFCPLCCCFVFPMCLLRSVVCRSGLRLEHLRICGLERTSKDTVNYLLKEMSATLLLAHLNSADQKKFVEVYNIYIWYNMHICVCVYIIYDNIYIYIHMWSYYIYYILLYIMLYYIYYNVITYSIIYNIILYILLYIFICDHIIYIIYYIMLYYIYIIMW